MPARVSRSRHSRSDLWGRGTPAGLPRRHPDVRRTLKGLFWALSSCAAFGLSGPLAKGLMVAGWSPATTITARMFGAVLVMGIPAIIMLRGRWRLVREHALYLIGYGMFAVAGTQFSYYMAVRSLSIGVALLIEYLAPVIVVGFLWARYGQRPGRMTLAGVGLAILGLVLVLDVGGAVRFDGVGLVWALCAACCLASYFVLSARQIPELPPFVIVGVSMLVACLSLLLIALTGLVEWTWSTAPVQLGPWTVAPIVPIVALVLATSVFAFGAGIMGARILGSRVASFVSLSEVLAAIGFAWLFLGELPTLMQVFGGFAILAGAALVKLAEVRAAAVGIVSPAHTGPMQVLPAPPEDP